MGLPRPAWPIGITPEDVRIHAERPEPVVLQEPMLEPLIRRTAEYQRRMSERRRLANQQQVQPVAEQQQVPPPPVQQQVQAPPVQQQVQAPPIIRRQSERIKQILFNRPPSPGPGLTEDDAISLE